MLKNLKVGTQITLGFGLVLTLLVVISTAAYIGLGTAVQGFTEYRELARDANLAGRVQANMLLARLYAKDYILTKSDQSAANFRQRFKHMEEFVGEAKVEIQKPERARLVASIDSEVGKYGDGFEQVVEFMARRDRVVKEQLDPNGLAAREEMSKLMESAFRDGEADEAYYAGYLQEGLMLARLYAAKFLTTNSREDVERAHKEIDETVRQRAEQLELHIVNHERKGYLARFREAVNNYRQALDDIDKIITQRNAVITGQLDRIGPLVADESEEVKLSVQRDQDELGPRVQAHNEQTVTTVVSLSIGAILVGLFLSWLIARMIKQPLGGEPADMARIASEIAEGNLEVRFDNDTKATGLYASMREMAENLRNIVIEVRQSTEAVAGGAGEIAQGNADLSQRTEEQASSLEETASSMEELTSTVKQNAENARQANQMAEGARREAENGGQVVSQAVSAMTEINASSKKIADIIGVIDEIAFQTNLLALNAAVEAARAGDQGRGFAVVAQEVRKLAQRSADSAKEISDLIKDSLVKVEEGSKLVDASGSALQEIMQSVKSVTDVVAEIAAASAEQTSGIEQVNKAVMQMDEVTQQNAALVEEAAAASKSLETQAENMRQQMSFFKVKDGGGGGGSSSRRSTSSGSAASYHNHAAAARKPAATAGRAGPTHKLPHKSPAPKPAEDDENWEEF
jgi:methyl-accepting chemotaxis protein